MQFGSDWNSVKPHQSDGFAGLLGRKGRLIQSAEQRQINENGMDGGECEVVSDTKKNRSGEMSCVTWDVCSSVTLQLELAFG